jgi:hypothetical protein
MEPLDFIENTRQKIAQGLLDVALKELKAYTQEKKVLKNEVIGLAGRYATLRNEQNAGHLLPQEYKVQEAKIRSAVLELLDRLEKKMAKQKPSSPNTDKRTLPWLPIVGVLIILIVGYFVQKKLAQTPQEPIKADTTQAVDSTKLFPPSLGKLPNVDFPRLADLEAQANDQVLTPVLSDLTKQQHAPKANPVLHYTTGVVVKTGKYVSEVKVGNQTSKVPNAWLIPLSKSLPPAGALFFTRNLLGRFVVVDAQNKKKVTASVRLSGTLPSQRWIAQSTPLNISASWFLAVKEGFYAGATIACQQNQQYILGTVIRAMGEKVLVKTYDHTVRVFDKKACRFAHLNPRIKYGNVVYVPKQGVYVKATVTQVNKRLRQVYVKLKHQSKSREEVYFIGTVFEQRDLEH